MVNMSISGFIKGESRIGGLGGIFHYDTHSIRDVEVSSSLTATSYYAGGILGYAHSLTMSINNASINVSLSGSNIGTIIGVIDNSLI